MKRDTFFGLLAGLIIGYAVTKRRGILPAKNPVYFHLCINNQPEQEAEYVEAWGSEEQ